MEPRTPPRGSRSARDFPATPATPRFGSFGDLPSHPARGAAGGDGAGKITKDSASSTRAPAAHTPLRRKRSRNVLATPRQTPRKVRDAEDRDPGLQTDLLAKLRAPDAAPQQASSQQASSQQAAAQKAAAPQKAAPHPHPHSDAPPPDVPGMWYVFRGKKVFRPFPPGEEPLKPVTLFKDILGGRKPARVDRTDLFIDTLREERDDQEDSEENDDAAADYGSEADTDIEWDPV